MRERASFSTACKGLTPIPPPVDHYGDAPVGRLKKKILAEEERRRKDREQRRLEREQKQKEKGAQKAQGLEARKVREAARIERQQAKREAAKAAKHDPAGKDE